MTEDEPESHTLVLYCRNCGAATIVTVPDDPTRHKVVRCAKCDSRYFGNEPPRRYSGPPFVPTVDDLVFLRVQGIVWSEDET